MRDNGCSLHDDGKFWDCRTSGQFPNWNFVRLGSLVVKCPGCCTDVVGSIPGPDTCDRQRLGQELHWWHYSQKCVGLVCPPQLPYQIQQKNLIPINLTDLRTYIYIKSSNVSKVCFLICYAILRMTNISWTPVSLSWEEHLNIDMLFIAKKHISFQQPW